MERAKTPAQVYDEFFVPGMAAPCAAALLEVVPPREGDRLLDLACGSGVVARAAAPLVGEQGQVVAVDFLPGMIEVASSLPAPPGPGIQWRVGDASALSDPDGAFDAVYCQQGLQFFPDKQAAAREIRRVTAPDGRVGVAVWQGLERNEVFRELTEAEARHLSEVGLGYEEVALPFLFGDPAWLRSVLAGAGFSDVRVEERTIEGRFPADGFIQSLEFAYTAMVPQFAEDPNRFAAFVEAVDADVRATLDRHRDGDEIVFPIAINIAAVSA